MLTHTMSHEQQVLEARKDLPALRNQLVEPVRRLRREFEQYPQGPITHMIAWASPRKNNWLAVIEYDGQRVSTCTLAWYRDRQKRISAIWTTAQGMAYHIAAEVIAGYAGNLDASEDPLERLQSFFFENHRYALQVEEPKGEHHWHVSIGLHAGLGLGEWDTTTDIVYWRELVSFDRSLLEMEPRQRMELYDRARGQEPGKQGRAA